MRFYKDLLKIVAVLILFKITIILFTKQEIEYLINITVIVVSLMIDPSNVKEMYKRRKLK